MLLVAWFAGIAALTGTGFFLQPSEGLPLRILPFAALPPLLFLLAHRWLPAVQAWVEALDLAMAVALQSLAGHRHRLPRLLGLGRAARRLRAPRGAR